MKRPRFPRILASFILACATTIAVAWGLALWVAVQNGRGVVARDGDHLQPWIMRIARTGAERIIYFEKGRIYNQPNVGPANGSSSAVSCWSFATSTRSNPKFTRGEVALPAAMTAEMDHRPRTAWGIAEDRRGWPFLAFASTIVGVTATDVPHVYNVRGGIHIEPNTSSVSYTRAESLADIRVLPMRVIPKGAIFNTLFAAAAWYLILSLSSWLTSAIKHALRTPAGHCPKCNYDLRGDLASGCPECGWNRGDSVRPEARHS